MNKAKLWFFAKSSKFYIARLIKKVGEKTNNLYQE